jgi:hypothetical protein
MSFSHFSGEKCVDMMTQKNCLKRNCQLNDSLFRQFFLINKSSPN